MVHPVNAGSLDGLQSPFGSGEVVAGERDVSRRFTFHAHESADVSSKAVIHG